MTTTLTAVPDTASTTADLDQRVALIACGTLDDKTSPSSPTRATRCLSPIGVWGTPLWS
jgi:hypothetical protein